jgi:hypothetical protein
MVAVMLASFGLASQSPAMNWEGHDSWPEDMEVLENLREGVKPAIVKPLPDCKLLRVRHAANVYEQTALPGKNCVEVEK